MAIKYLPASHFVSQGAKARTSIWAINTADQSSIGVVAEVLLNIPSTNGGKPDALLVPQTWLPVELTKEIPRGRLLSSSEFLRAVSRGLIGLIDEDTAQRLLRTSDAEEEQARLTALREHIKKAGAPRTIADSNSEIARADGQKDDDDTSGRNKTVIIDYDAEDNRSVADQAADGVEDHEPGISAQFNMWVNKLNIGTDADAKNQIKGRRSFSKAELGFLHRNLNRKFAASIAMIAKNLGNGKAKK